MSGFRASLSAEARDLSRHPLAWLAVAATAAAAWAAGANDPVKGNGYLVFEAAAGAGARVAGFFLLAAAATAVASDRTRGTVRWILPRPVSRAGYVLGKAAAHAGFAAALLGVCVLASWLVARGHGFPDLVAEDSMEGFDFVEEAEVDPELTAQAMTGRMRTTALALLPALLTASGLGILASTLLRSSASAVIVALAAAVPLVFLPELLGLNPDAARAVPFRAAQEFLDQLRQFGRMLSTRDWPEYDWRAGLGAAAGAAGLPLSGALVFSRLDLTD